MAENKLTNPSSAPWPFGGKGGRVILFMGGYVPNGVNGSSEYVDEMVVPFDCIVKEVYYTANNGAANLDAVTLVCVNNDVTKTIVAAQDLSADVHAALQTLYADMVDTSEPSGRYVLKQGSLIKLSADTQSASEAGDLKVRLHVVPAHVAVA